MPGIKLNAGNITMNKSVMVSALSRLRRKTQQLPITMEDRKHYGLKRTGCPQIASHGALGQA